MSALLDRFVPRPDVVERHETLVRAPAEIVYQAAYDFDLQSNPIVRAIFWLREKLSGGTARPRAATGLVRETLGLGWGVLAERPGRELVMGAYTQPWHADVVFHALPPGQFASFAEPGFVKIAWTIEAEPLGAALTRAASETRVVATDEEARVKFRRYWRLVGAGIVLIRWLMLPAVRREAERRYRARSARNPTRAS